MNSKPDYKGKSCIIVCRISKEEDGDRETTLRNQYETCKRYAEETNLKLFVRNIEHPDDPNSIIVKNGAIIEQDVSGEIPLSKRKIWGVLLKMLQEWYFITKKYNKNITRNPVPYILCTRDDRLARGNVLGHTKTELSKIGVQVINASYGKSRTEKEAEGFLSKLFMDNQKKLVRETHITRIRNKTNISRPPFGYQNKIINTIKKKGKTVNEYEIQIIEELIPVLRLIFSLKRSGKSTYKIVEIINSKFHKELRTIDLKVTRKIVRNVLTNPAYLGYFRIKNADSNYLYKGENLRRIISEKVFTELNPDWKSKYKIINFSKDYSELYNIVDYQNYSNRKGFV